MHEANGSGRDDGDETYLENRRTFEFFFIAGVLCLGIPIAVLYGARAGERDAAALNASPAATAAWPAGDR